MLGADRTQKVEPLGGALGGALVRARPGVWRRLAQARQRHPLEDPYFCNRPPLRLCELRHQRAEELSGGGRRLWTDWKQPAWLHRIGLQPGYLRPQPGHMAPLQAGSMLDPCVISMAVAKSITSPHHHHRTITTASSPPRGAYVVIMSMHATRMQHAAATSAGSVRARTAARRRRPGAHRVAAWDAYGCSLGT